MTAAVKRINVAPQRRKRKQRMFGMNTSYNFVDKDPICAIIAHLVKLAGIRLASKKSGVPVSTIYAITHGDTVSPRYSTVARLVRGIGGIVRIGETLTEWKRGA